jgi:hypothetical protein
VQARYLKHPDVLGVGWGTKFVGGRPTNSHAVHFYVGKKRQNPRRSLPKFVLHRKSNGKADRSRRIPTDVIELGKISFACGAGSRVDNTLGNIGTISLFFQNKAASGGTFLVTCAHVAKGSTELSCDCCPQLIPASSIVYMSTPVAGRLEYDIAIANVRHECSQSDLMIEGSSGPKLTGFLSRADITPGLNVDCALPVSLVSNANVYGGIAGTVQVGDLLVNNAFLLAASVMPGDSGGLLYSGGLAVGIVFALAEKGWSFFHPIEDAFLFAQQQTDLILEPF